jgi:hypothetical protein
MTLTASGSQARGCRVDLQFIQFELRKTLGTLASSSHIV